jgi:hypothetical protein
MPDSDGVTVTYRASWQCRNYPACEGISNLSLPWPHTPPLDTTRDGCGCSLQWVWRQPDTQEPKRRKKR